MTVDALARCLDDAALAMDDPRLQPVLGTSYGPHLDTANTTSLSQWAQEASAQSGLVRSPLTVTTACSAGSDTLLLALELLRSGAAEICVCGGIDVLTMSKRLGHSFLGTMSPDDLRAFDVKHDGTLLGEGAGFMVLEPEQSARARQARIHGFLSGAGSSNDAMGSVAPDASGRTVTLAVQRALSSGEVEAQDISVISAHGSGTPVSDAVEAKSYEQLFGSGKERPVVFATKGAFGHTLGATGSLGAITVVQALKSGLAPPVHGLEETIPGLSLPLPAGRPAVVRGRFGLSVTLGFGGFNTCLLFEGHGAATHEGTRLQGGRQ
jgi:3-oxoacyl-[acyl-carrier-protein] synthase II